MPIVLVTGSHTRGNQEHVFSVLDQARAEFKFDHLVCGGADYIDTFAMMWAMDRKVSFSVEYADWDRLGAWAGPARNQRMLDKYQISCVIAFNGDRGTNDMKSRARMKGIKVHDFDAD